MYGNMTQVEKALNRPDLEAYKNYDNNQYSLIPGVNAVKAIPGTSPVSAGSGKGKLISSPKRKSVDFEQKYHQKKNTLHQMGYNQDG